MKTEIVTPGDTEYEWLDERLVAFNRSHVDWSDDRFVVMLRGDDSSPVGGARRVVRFGAVEIRGLWLDDALRGRGDWAPAPSRLWKEKRAVAGATVALLDIYDFQAQGFYEGLGYTIRGSFRYPDVSIVRGFVTDCSLI